MFDADRPIQCAREDRLNRAQFAKYLARCILDQTDIESMVIGLYGDWGVGKTSLINMMIEELNFAATNMEDNQKPIILNFSPWSYSGQNELIYSFFRRLSSALRSAPYLEDADEIIYLLELYVSFFTHKPVPSVLQKKRSLYDRIFNKNKVEDYGWESGRDLTKVKAELNEKLKKLKHKIIIVIDNISRLYGHEIKQIFQIVKSMGDYNNTTYVLAFDKEQVAHALDQLEGGGGDEFIEKVIQLPFVIPEITAVDIENLLNQHLEELVLLAPVDSWNKEYWADVYYCSLKYFFTNGRDITRYINILSFSYSRLRDIVNPVDFFALTALEVFTPQVYSGIRDNKDLFTDLLDNVYAFDNTQINRDKARVEEILSRSDGIPREILLELFLKLFPRLHHIYQPELTFYHNEALARKLLRICSPDLFDAYFRLSMQSGSILTTEFETILASAKDAVSFDHALARLNQDNRVITFLNMLDDPILLTIPLENISPIISSLLDDGDLFPSGIENALSLPTSLRIHRIIHHLLQRYSDIDARYTVMKNAIMNANKSIYIIVHELKEQEKEHDQSEETYLPDQFRDLSPHYLDTLKKLTADRIQYWAKDERLLLHPQLIPILYAWRDWGKDDDCFNYVNEITKTDRGLVIFLTKALQRAIDMVSEQYVLNPAWENDLVNINSFINAETLLPHAKILFEDDYFEKLREKEQLALMIFLDLMHAKTNKVIPNTTS